MKQNDAVNYLFFSPLRTKDVTSRINFLEELKKTFEPDEVLRSYQNSNSTHEKPEYAEDYSRKYPVLLRLAYECPFQEVRISCGNILCKLEDAGIRIPRRKYDGPSKFISIKDTVQIDSEDDEVHMLFVEAFLSNGRVSHINQLMGYHVRYFSCFLEFESALMKSNGPLHRNWRYFIGILGASCHKCDILKVECETQFLMMGGNPKWLQGPEFLPVKLKKLIRLNKILAHQPWLISTEVIRDLMSGPAMETWTMTELLHAVIILVHYQTLSGFVFGCGVTPEIDSIRGHSMRSPSTSDYSSGSELLTPTKMRASSFGKPLEETGTTAQLLKKIQIATQEEENDNSQDEQKEEDKLRQFEEIETNELENEVNVDTTLNHSAFKLYGDIEDIHYEEFAKRKQKDIEVFRAHDYNWSQHCFSFINRVCPEMGTLLDNKFQCIYDLTYNTMGNNIEDVDTSKFRLATWNYIHLVYGIFHDDYVYYEVNKLLEKAYKSYIKKVACFPEHVTFPDYWDFYADLLPSEKVHINLLVLESRMQALLLYSSRCIMKCMNKQ